MNAPAGVGSFAKALVGSPRSTAGDTAPSAVSVGARSTGSPVVVDSTGAKDPPWKLPAVLCSWKSAPAESTNSGFADTLFPSARVAARQSFSVAVATPSQNPTRPVPVAYNRL